jgi:heme-degrading monooxygenase HmoA
MIARLWRGRVPAGKSPDYVRYLRETGFADYARTPGNRGVWLLRGMAEEKGETAFLALTFWDSMAAIKAFAGAAPERARYYPRDHEFLIEPDPHVEHFDVIDPMDTSGKS